LEVVYLQVAELAAGGKVEVEFNFLNWKLKAVTLYFGPLFEEQAARRGRTKHETDP
jgi:hypothetical protein